MLLVTFLLLVTNLKLKNVTGNFFVTGNKFRLKKC